MILKKCLEQDRISQKWVYENYYAFALKIAYRYSNSYDEAVSIVNDSFVNVFKSLHHILGNDETTMGKIFLGWLRKTVVNKALDSIRANKNKHIFEAIEDDMMDIADNESADTLLLYKEMIIFLKELPEHHRIVFNMYVIDGYTHSEIATILGISEGTSKSHLFRAKQTLQKQLTSFFEINK